MSSLSSRQKLVGAAVLLLALPLVALAQGGHAVTAARVLASVLALAGLAWWVSRGRTSKAFRLPPRLSVVGRVGLSQRAGLALVEVDGESYLVVHGEGFAQLRRTRRRAAAPMLVADEAEVQALPRPARVAGGAS